MLQINSSFSRARQSTVVVGIATAVLMLIIAVCYAQWRRYDRANRDATLTSDAIDSVGRLLSDLLDIEAGQRGYLLTGEDRYLEPYNRAIKAVPSELGVLRDRLNSHPGQADAVARLSDLVPRKLAEVRQTIEVRRAQGAAAALAIVLSDQGKRTMDQIRALCEQIERRERLRQRQASLDGQAAAEVALLITVTGSLVLLFFFALGFEPFLTRESRPADRRWYLRYGVATAAAVAATLPRLALSPLLGPGEDMVPYVTYFPAILFAAWYGGLRAGAFAVLLSTLAGDYFFLTPERSFRLRGPGELVSLLIFVVVGAGIAFMSDSHRRALARAAIAEDAEKHERERFETTLASIGDAVIATDAEGRVTFANKLALSLVAWPEKEIAGQHLDQVFRIVNEYSRQKVESPVTKVLREGTIVGLANHTVLLAQNGSEVPSTTAPLRSATAAARSPAQCWCSGTSPNGGAGRPRAIFFPPSSNLRATPSSAILWTGS